MRTGVRVPPSRIKGRLRRDKPSFLFCPTPSPTTNFVEMAAQAGYHGLWIDHEHQNLTDREIADMCVACRAGRIDAMLRVRKRDDGSFFRALEIGAHGIMLPHCNSPEEAAAAVRQVKFPPVGNRSLDGVEPHSLFGLVPPDEYTQQANDDSFVVVQIEEPEGVHRVEEIAAVDGVDVLFVGPGDLGLRYADRADPAAAVEAAVDRVATAARAAGKHWGITAGSPAILKQRVEQGARLLGFGSVFFHVFQGLRQAHEALKEWLE